LLRDDKADIPFPNCWDIPGGHVEEGETPEECIRREMLEEMELAVTAPRLFRISRMPDRVETTFWVSRDIDIARVILHEGQGLRWFSEDEVAASDESQIAFGFRSVLLEFFRQRPWLNPLV
jgi:8-oxo-dGTP diphosphatase